MLTAKEQMLLDALEPIAQSNNLEIVTVEVVGSKKSPTVRIYLDGPDGISFDDISTAQEWINTVVDAIDPFPGAYVLEVSSPGIDRPLRTPAHFMRFIGNACVLKSTQAIDGRANFTATIEDANENELLLNDGTQTYHIDYALIKKAHLKGTVDFKRKEEK